MNKEVKCKDKELNNRCIKGMDCKIYNKEKIIKPKLIINDLEYKPAKKKRIKN